MVKTRYPDDFFAVGDGLVPRQQLFAPMVACDRVKHHQQRRGITHEIEQVIELASHDRPQPHDEV
ncbi:hypothetical protein ABFA25_09150 [Mycobacterium lepromatosis]|uniref:hypothetical protein n=1 Tax=Mycobacterium lepromatosis TaxID=480418 RepID=UPI003D8040EC